MFISANIAYLLLCLIELRYSAGCKESFVLTSQYAAQKNQGLKIRKRAIADALSAFWLPRRYAQKNFFAYHFKFLMVPAHKNHPRTEYVFSRI